MSEKRWIDVFFEHAIAVVVARPGGAVVHQHIHKDVDCAPLKLLVLIERNKGGKQRIVGEIGIGKGHPGRSNNSLSGRYGGRLPHRPCAGLATETFLRGVSINIIGIFQRLLERKIVRWKSPSFSRWSPKERVSVRRRQIQPVVRQGRHLKVQREIPRGITVSVDHGDEMIGELLRELEWFNPRLQNRISMLPKKKLNRLTERRQSSLWNAHPHGLNETVRLFMRSDSAALLRPHILGAILRKTKHGREILRALNIRGVISPECFKASKRLLDDETLPPLPLRLLSRTAHSKRLFDGEELWVMFCGCYPSHTSFRVALPPDATRIIWSKGNQAVSGGDLDGINATEEDLFSWFRADNPELKRR